jgi:hypothetical protein
MPIHKSSIHRPLQQDAVFADITVNQMLRLALPGWLRLDGMVMHFNAEFVQKHGGEVRYGPRTF